MSKLALHGTRVLTPKGLTEATVFIENGIITAVEDGLANENGLITTSTTDVIMPGLIDSHVHINEPGRTEWEGFDTATKAAAASGITTLVDMPLNSSPVSVDLKSFKIKLEATEANLHVNCGFWGGLIPENIDPLEELIESGVLGIKAFLTHSGIDEFPNVTEEDLRKALPILKKHNTVLLVHCELDAPHADEQLLKDNPTSYQAYLKSRPRKWEDDAIALMIKLCEEYDTPVHIVHLSSSDSIEQIRKAQQKGIKITVETCPQYLYFNAENIPDASTQYKCAPPIREKSNNDLLWDELKVGGILDFIVTDHSPAPPEIKELESGDFSKAWGGIAGLQFSLPVIWTKAKEKGFSVEDISGLMSSNVSDFLKLNQSKGKIEVGYDADLVIWNPEEEFIVKEGNILHRHKTTPYLNQTLKGVVKQTYVQGELVYDKGEFKKLNKGNIILKK